ncbi:hypothetical protein DYU11_25190 [Fibrisoma montanum]|uniref:Uncharacterized protein n=1 Tax=Fibrisoma montanum TaxID=2305895 RepID=A0A418M127_9BACT|nr:hypothetical protein [Fibrisoma montanum]RIV19399.1 hypothetical protein DYU11_25190 [Fibrisoma montanum]
MADLHQELKKFLDKDYVESSENTPQSFYNSVLLKAEAEKLIGEIYVFLEEHDIEFRKDWANPRFTPRAAMEKPYANTMAEIYKESYSMRVQTLARMISTELNIPFKTEDYYHVIPTSESAGVIDESIKKVATRLARLAAQLLY